MGRTILAILVWMALWATLAGQALAQQAKVDVPPALEPWRAWVLYGATDKLCPPDGNNADARICLFPTSLTLSLEPSGAAFTAKVRLLDEGFAALPFGAGAWLGPVSVDGKPAPVTQANGAPMVWLAAGDHTLEGRLGWNTMPQALRLPPETGLVRLMRQEGEVTPDISPAGELRLTAPAAAKPVENRENVRVFRLVSDGVPVTITTFFRLEVSGLARTITLAGAVPAGTVPLAVRAPVPATFGPDGALLLDAGPGRFDVEVVSRYPGKVETVGPATCPYGREIWSFAADADLREVRPEGLPAIDPKTAEVPEAWKAYPAFLAEAKAALTLRELGRGAPLGRNALRLARELWVDFSGQGLTARDVVTGENREIWTLAMLPPGELGRVTLAGRDQPVVRLGPDNLSGVELRDVRLNLVAESRYPKLGASLPAGGFDREFDGVTATVNLPPGWRLLTAAGPDEVRGGVLSDWTLLDLFLVFVMAVAAFSLRGPAAGLVLGLFLLLSWQEPRAPTFVWLYLLAALGLLRLAGEAGRLAAWPGLRRWGLVLFGLAVVCVAGISIPFVIDQLRGAVAPQVGQPVMPYAGAPVMPAARPEAMAPPAPAPMAGRKAKVQDFLAQTAGPQSYERLDFDPNALIQTGPGLPSWHWRSVFLNWRGPVVPEQTMRLVLLPPLANRLLAVLRVVLLGLALYVLFDRKLLQRLARPAATAGLAFLVMAMAGPRTAWAGDFPSQELLETFKSRLTAAPRCLPHCLGSPSLEVRLSGDRLFLVTAVDAAVRAAVPLPTVSEGWRPGSVLLDGAPAAGLTRQGGELKILAEPGRHVVALEGPLPEAVSFSIVVPLPPGRVIVDAPGFQVRGLDAQGVLRGVLEFTRAQTPSGTEAKIPATPLGVPPFFEVERALDLGLSWEAATTVTRRSPATEAAVVGVPLLPGEAPDSADVAVRDGRAMVSFKPGQERVSWRSRLPVAPRLTLLAATDQVLVETWTLTAAPFYDVRFDGIAPTSRVGEGGRWQPRFTPWPGERLAIDVTRPEAAPGAFVTIESARLTSRQGGQVRDNDLVLGIRASKGARHAVKLPAGAEVTGLVVGGRETLPTGGPGEVGFAVSPGVTEVTIHFREQTPLGLLTRTPAVDLGLPAANVETRLEIPWDRWLLAVYGSTPLGPVVLYWGWLAVVVAISLGLSTVPGVALTRRQWFLYALGLSQATPGNFLLAAGWLVALGLRRRHPIREGAFAFNLVQVLLVLLTLAGLVALYDTLGAGLLGVPRMQVTGNGSTAASLVWTYDRIAGAVPVGLAASAPMFVFRVLMLAWAVWLAWSLLAWLRWGFDCLTQGGGWRRVGLSLRLPRRRESGPARDQEPDKP